jgi:hypothetical protein
MKMNLKKTLFTTAICTLVLAASGEEKSDAPVVTYPDKEHADNFHDKRAHIIKEFLKRHDMIYERHAKKREQGMPMGNGLIGTVLWGGGNDPLKLSLDQAHIWEL